MSRSSELTDSQIEENGEKGSKELDKILITCKTSQNRRCPQNPRTKHFDRFKLFLRRGFFNGG